MAYTSSSFEVLAPVNLDSNQTAWRYSLLTDTLAEMKTANYFTPTSDPTDKLPLVKVKDTFSLVASDGVDTTFITSLNPIVVDTAHDQLKLTSGEIFFGVNGEAVSSNKVLNGDHVAGLVSQQDEGTIELIWTILVPSVGSSGTVFLISPLPYEVRITDAYIYTNQATTVAGDEILILNDSSAVIVEAMQMNNVIHKITRAPSLNESNATIPQGGDIKALVNVASASTPECRVFIKGIRTV